MSSPPAAGARLVVFTSDPSYSVRLGIVDIDTALPGLQWLVLWQRPRRSPGQLLRSQRMNLRRHGWRWVPYQLADVAGRLAPARAGAAPDSAPGREHTLAALQQRPNLRLLAVDDLHGATALDAVRDFAPDLGLSLAAPILRRSLFAAPRLGTLNLHKGKVPEFRGMPVAFWELWFDQPEVGCTVHWVDDQLDTGRVVAEASVQRAPHATVRGLQLELDDVGARLTLDAVRAVLAGTAASRQQPAHGGKTHRKPTLAQVGVMRRREQALQPARPPLAQHAAKESALAVLGAGLRLAAPLRQPRVTVLLYHRVSDEVRDNLTVGVAQFDRQMALLRRHCDVVDIQTIVEMDAAPRGRRPLVAVTFDDGYLDNYRHAAPILRRHGVPAAFFVSTGIVASNNRFPHDVWRGNPWIPVMNWEQLREMRRWGFTIGSHTVSHIDCAAEPEAVVRAELAQSRDDLRRELGIERPILAYPFGGRQHMTAERLPWVAAAGYAGCLSAYGGSNVGAIDRWNIVRRGIHWEFSDRALLLQCLGR